MKFTLTYDGSLPSSGNRAKVEEKWAIRCKFHPQLKDLWDNHPALHSVWEDRHFPKYGGASVRQTHHEHPGPVLWDPNESRAANDILDLCAPINKHGVWFRPLVRTSFALHCGLKILFLRKEPPGRVYQGGDIDGRIKTLLDALTIPQHIEQIARSETGTAGAYDHDPILCLLQEDSLVSGLQVETERLLTDQGYPADFARLTIEVDVRVHRPMIYNQSFLG